MNNLKQILYPVFIFTILVILSWLLIHLLTLFGIFLAIAYPLWWILAPKQTICVFCRSRNDGQTCNACHQVVHKADGFAPKTFSSAVYNGLILLAFSLLSIGIVFTEGQLLFRLGYPTPFKTVSFSTSTQQKHQIGEIFPLQVNIRGMKESINAVSLNFSYNPDQLQVVDISTKDSFANIFIDKKIDNNAGTGSLIGGLANPGYSGDKGNFATVYLRGLKPGITTVRFLPSSSVLANNGRGDNLLSSFGSASYLIVSDTPNDTDQPKQPGVGLDNVLGASTPSGQTQMIFYDDQQVLGANTANTEIESPTKERTDTPLDVVSRIDTFILTFWGKLL
jgi:hypothetical protein